MTKIIILKNTSTNLCYVDKEDKGITNEIARDIPLHKAKSIAKDYGKKNNINTYYYKEI